MRAEADQHSLRLCGGAPRSAIGAAVMADKLML